MFKRIIIVGGGTAGWLAANHLARQLRPKDNSHIQIRLVESPDIATVGVGEGTVPTMRSTLQYLGISETDFIRECDVTFKQSIKFVNWLDDPKIRPHAYHHPFDYPAIDGTDLTPYWLLGQLGENTPYADVVGVQSRICESELAPKTITDPEFSGLAHYAYHLDAGKFSSLLKRHATEKLGVEYLSATVESVTLHDNGHIRSVITKECGELEADFFIDCTGFSARLIGQSLDVPFIDKSGVLFADSALAVQLAYDSTESPIPSYTLATAQSAGWIWDIGLTARRGVGHVYSSRYIGDEQAHLELAAYLGKQPDEVNARKIAMQVGYRERAWQANCVAMGLAQGFVEPLEATGLLVFDITARMLAEQFPGERRSLDISAKHFNRRVTNLWDRVIDFIKLHYCLSKRSDSQFWLDNRAQESIPESLKERLDLWRYQLPKTYDFASTLEVFNLENYLYVLYGMEFETDLTALASRYPSPHIARERLAQINQGAAYALKRLEPNRKLLNKIHRHGLQKI